MFEIMKKLDGQSLIIIDLRITYLDNVVMKKILIYLKNKIDDLEGSGYTKTNFKNDFLQIKSKIKSSYIYNSSFTFVYDKWKKKVRFYNTRKD